MKGAVPMSSDIFQLFVQFDEQTTAGRSHKAKVRLLNTWGLYRVSYDTTHRLLTVFYDQSRVTVAQIMHLLVAAGVSVTSVRQAPINLLNRSTSIPVDN